MARLRGGSKANSPERRRARAAFEGLAAPLGGEPASGWKPAGTQPQPARTRDLRMRRQLLRRAERPRRGGRARRLRRRRRTASARVARAAARAGRASAKKRPVVVVAEARPRADSSRPARTTKGRNCCSPRSSDATPTAGPRPLRRLRLLLRRTRKQRQASGLVRGRDAADVRLGHARLRARVERKHLGIPRRQRHHARRSAVGAPQRGRTRGGPRAGRGAGSSR